MFSLISDTDSSVIIEGVEYTVNDSYDNILKVFAITKENATYEGLLQAVALLLGKLPPVSLDKMERLFNRLVDIYIGEKKSNIEVDLNGDPLPVKKEKEYFSFVYDAELIYAGFIQAYGIDLKKCRGKLRWCDFKALLEGLPSDTRFKEVIEIRQSPYPSGKGTGKEKEKLKKIKRAVSYPGRDFDLD